MGKIKDFRKYVEQAILPGHDPSFMIIGAQKSGTTTLFSYLDKHPKLAGSWPKEMHYFSRYLLRGNDLAWYRKHFTSLKKNPLYFEASPNYMYFESVAKEIKRTYPGIKLIIILRNPVDRAFSAWNMYYDHFTKGKLLRSLPPRTLNGENLMYKNLTEGRIAFPSFHEAITIEQGLIEKGEQGGVNFLRRGLYYKQISTYLQYFERNQLFILGIKDLVRDPKKAVSDILAFLGVDNAYSWEPPTLKVKNKRSYPVTLEKTDKDFLIEFYKDSNERLTELLGHQVNW